MSGSLRAARASLGGSCRCVFIVGLPFVLVAWGRVGRVCLVCRVGRVVLGVPCRDSRAGTAVSCRATVRVRPRSGLWGAPAVFEAYRVIMEQCCKSYACLSSTVLFP